MESLKKEFPNLADRIRIEKGDANEVLSTWCSSMQRSDRAVVFLDPYGMQVKWRLLENIAKTKAIDLWILFPLSAVIRMLPHDHKIQESWRNRLTALFGTDEWEDKFYKESIQLDFIDNKPGLERVVNFEAIEKYFVERLEAIFPFVAEKVVYPSVSRYEQINLLTCSRSSITSTFEVISFKIQIYTYYFRIGLFIKKIIKFLK